MSTPRRAVFGLSLCCAFGIGLAAGCKKEETRSPGDEGNLCTDYTTCNDCIAGLQRKGSTEGEAETQCGAAVLGCWTTWDKPIVCGDKEYDEQP
jgi:hypothetical protein